MALLSHMPHAGRERPEGAEGGRAVYGCEVIPFPSRGGRKFHPFRLYRYGAPVRSPNLFDVPAAEPVWLESYIPIILRYALHRTEVAKGMQPARTAQMRWL